LYGIEYGHEYVRVVIGPLVLYDRHKPLEAHATINVLLGQWPQGAITLSVELNEHKVPYFQHVRVIFVDQMSSLSTPNAVKVELRARTARSGFTHLPEVIFHAAWENVRCWYSRILIGFSDNGNNLKGLKVKLPKLDPQVFAFIVRQES
jgi:hypothetical protein